MGIAILTDPKFWLIKILLNVRNNKISFAVSTHSCMIVVPKEKHICFCIHNVLFLNSVDTMLFG